MQVVATFGTLAFVLVGAIVGGRMLLLAHRTGQLPELYLGGALFLFAVVGQPFLMASRALGEAYGRDARMLAVGVGLLSTVVAVASVLLFTRTVFRPGSVLAAVAVWLGSTVAVASATAVLAFLPEVAGDYGRTVKLGVGALALDFVVGMLWTAAESLRYHGLMRRRLSLGLADAVVVNRFLLWGAGCGAAGLAGLAMVGCLRAGWDLVVHPAPLLLIATAGTIVASCWYLTFLPPDAYLRWVGGRASGQEG